METYTVIFLTTWGAHKYGEMAAIPAAEAEACASKGVARIVSRGRGSVPIPQGFLEAK